MTELELRRRIKTLEERIDYLTAKNHQLRYELEQDKILMREMNKEFRELEKENYLLKCEPNPDELIFPIVEH